MLRRLLLIASGLCLAAAALATGPKLSFEYGFDGDFRFDNREFSVSDERLSPSMTIGAVVLTPSVGVGFGQSDSARHRLMAGVDLRRDFGSGQTTDIFQEVTLWYDVCLKLPRGCFKAAAGVFPRSKIEGEYSEAFWSDSLRFNDRNLDGVLLEWRSSDFFAELGLDWMGMAGYDRKERFEIFSSLRWDALEWLSLGWSAVMYHYAGSELSPGVVDNHKFNPYVRLSAAHLTGMQDLSLKAGPVLTYQWDRVNDASPVTPCGAEFVLGAQKWNISVQNTTYLGQNLMYYYEGRDTGGFPYGNNLYRGLNFYRGFYDRLEIFWTPHFTSWLDFRLGARLHFDSSGYLGWAQVASLTVHL